MWNVDLCGYLVLLNVRGNARALVQRSCESMNQLVVDLSNQTDNIGLLKEQIYLVNAPRSRDKKERRGICGRSYTPRLEKHPLSMLS